MPPVENESPVTSLYELGKQMFSSEQKEMIESARQARRDKHDMMSEKHGLDFMHRCSVRRDPEKSWPPEAGLYQIIKKRKAPIIINSLTNPIP